MLSWILIILALACVFSAKYFGKEDARIKLSLSIVGLVLAVIALIQIFLSALK